MTPMAEPRRRWMVGALPLGEIMPVQMCRNLYQLGDVVINGLKDPQADNFEEEMDAMDRLADML